MQKTLWLEMFIGGTNIRVGYMYSLWAVAFQLQNNNNTYTTKDNV